MCLTSVSIPKYTGDKEIICYKVLNHDCTSMYRGFSYYFHKLYNTRITFAPSAFPTHLHHKFITSVSEILVKQYELTNHYYKNYHENSFWENIRACCKYHSARYNDMIFKGFHSFKEFDDAKIHHNICKSIVVKCHIPKYTWYYEGIDSSTTFPAYTSESIILDEIVNIC